MKSRTAMPQKERSARSRLTQLLHNEEVLRGSLVTMSRTCGKPNCRCQQGDKHVSLYLAIRVEGKRKLVYIPEDLEPTVREAVSNYQESHKLVEDVSQMCLQRVLHDKDKPPR